MASIERTAYPRYASGRTLKEHELEKFYSLTPEELHYINVNIRGDVMSINFAIQLKTFQRLGYFPELNNVPKIIVEHIKKCLSIFNIDIIPYYDHDKTRL